MSLPLSGDLLPSALLSRMWALLPIEHQEGVFVPTVHFPQTTSSWCQVTISMIKTRTSLFSLYVLTRFTGAVYPLVPLLMLWIRYMLWVHLLHDRTAVLNVRNALLALLTAVLRLLQLLPAVHLHHLLVGIMPSLVQRPSAVKVPVHGSGN